MDLIKPPIGIMPRAIHEKQRLSDLVRAIDRYIDADMYTNNYAELLSGWAEELKERLDGLSVKKQMSPVLFSGDRLL